MALLTEKMLLLILKSGILFQFEFFTQLYLLSEFYTPGFLSIPVTQH